MTRIDLTATIADLRDGFQQGRIALYLAWGDIRARYRRSVLGPFWQSLGTAIGVVGLALVWSELLNIDREEFIPSLTAGLIIWQMIAGVLSESPGSFLRQSAVIRNLVLPLSIHPINLLIRHVVNFAHNLVVFVLVALVMRVPIGWETLLFIPGMLLVLLNLFWIAIALGVLGARYRDVEYAVVSLLPILFLISPVMYRLESVPFSSTILAFNPLTYFTEVIREPMLGKAPSTFDYGVLSVMALGGWTLAAYLLARAKRRMAFWI